MDLSFVPEIGPVFGEKLREAGVESVEALAVWDDMNGLAERVGVERERLESFRDAARMQLERALASEGIQGPEQLIAADVVALAERTGLDRVHLARYQAAARDAITGPDAKVVLVDGAPVARVTVGGATHHAVQLVTAAGLEEDDDILARAGGDAVVLRAAVDAVPARVAGVTHRALPLYKERRVEGREPEEVRVRVAEIREVAEKKKGGLGRLFGRK